MEPMTLKECLSSFSERFNRPRGEDAQARYAFFEFVGVSSSAAAPWFRGDREPVSERRLRTIAFFQLLGYNVVEYSEWNAAFQDACKLVAFKFVSTEEIARASGFTGKDAAHSLYKVFAGKQNFSTRTRSAFTAFVEGYRELLQEVESEFKQEHKALLLPGVSETESVYDDEAPELAVQQELPVPLAERSQSVALQLTPQQAAEQLALLVRLALPYAEYLNSETCTAEHRDLLREYAGKNSVFKLNNLLTPLCGERMREKLKGDRS